MGVRPVMGTEQFEVTGWLAVPAEFAARCEWGQRRFTATRAQQRGPARTDVVSPSRVAVNRSASWPTNQRP